MFRWIFLYGHSGGLDQKGCRGRVDSREKAAGKVVIRNNIKGIIVVEMLGSRVSHKSIFQVHSVLGNEIGQIGQGILGTARKEQHAAAVFQIIGQHFFFIRGDIPGRGIHDEKAAVLGNGSLGEQIQFGYIHAGFIHGICCG